MAWNFKDFPELPNSQLDFYYFQSPHKQLFEPFWAHVVRVHDADTIIVRMSERDFEFPVRINNISARELKETPERDTSNQLCMDGVTAQSWLEEKLLNEEVMIIPSKGRVEKWGRLLASVMHQGIDIGIEQQWLGVSTNWESRNDGKLPRLKEVKNGA